jgi:hypothetical protein
MYFGIRHCVWLITKQTTSKRQNVDKTVTDSTQGVIIQHEVWKVSKQPLNLTFRKSHTKRLKVECNFGNPSATIHFKCRRPGFGEGISKEPSATINGGRFREILK